VRHEQNSSGLYVIENKPQDVSREQALRSQVDLRADVESMSEEEVKEYVLALMEQQERRQATHPSALKGESLHEVKEELEGLRKKFEQAKKETNNVRVHIEAQKRIIERNQLEKSHLHSRPQSGKVRPGTAKKWSLTLKTFAESLLQQS